MMLSLIFGMIMGNEMETWNIMNDVVRMDVVSYQVFFTSSLSSDLG